MIATALDTDSRDAMLRDHLSDALRNGGFGKLAEGKRRLPDRTELAVIALFVATFVSYVAIGMKLGLSVLLAVVAGVVTFLVVMLISLAIGRDDEEKIGLIGFSLIALTILGGGGAEIVEIGWSVLLLTHVVPFALASLIVFLVHRFEGVTVRRTLDATKRVALDVPILFPFIVLVMFALILNAEVWLVGADESPVRLAVLGAVVIVPLMTLLHRRLVRSIDAIMAETAEDIAARAPVTELLTAVRATAGHRAANWIEEHALEEMRACLSAMDAGGLGREVSKRMAGSFERRILTRLALTVVAVGITAFVIIYGLSWLMVSADAARSWSQVNTFDDWVVAGVSLPLGPYPRVAAMLAIIASSIFVAFVLTTDSLLDGFRSAYVKSPAAAALLLTVAYRAAEARLAAQASPEEPTSPETG